MRKLPFIAGLLLFAVHVWAQSPHGDKLTLDCADCHTTGSWIYEADSSIFNHDVQTSFTLEGQHQYTDCRQCHETLVFSDAQNECVSCHTDMHNTTVGTDCARCHDASSWIVDNITGIHQQSRFPLLGAHNTADCSACHTSASNLEFQPLGINCIDCHRDDYNATTEPNHQQAGFSENCFECHSVDAHQWSSDGFNHSFFPLTKGHETNDCTMCHGNNILEPISSDCVSCHQEDYNSANNPQHLNSGFSTSCAECHTTDPGWKPAHFEQHDQLYFPVYSGNHGGEWDNCFDCHLQPENYTVFSCTDCHEHPVSKMNDEHDDVGGYSSDSYACYACHPQGNENGAFNHNSTGFPLTGAHTSTGCIECHSDGYGGTSTLCSSCHTDNYNQAANPVHTEAGISKECEICHNTTAWDPSVFNHSETGFELSGGHDGLQCAQCHQGTTTGASSDCYSCHQGNYNEAENHLAQGYPFECTQCHTTVSWEGAEFDHNATNFPLTGSHQSTGCLDCHTDGYTGTPMDCASCHTNNYNETSNPNHTEVGIQTVCEDCHNTDAWDPSTFNHTTTGFELTGGHAGRQCAECHRGTTTGTSSDCYSCHQQDYDDAEGHVDGNFPKECTQCHTTNNWEAANFDHNTTNFPLTGSHQATGCLECHTDGYAGTPTDCASCHTDNFNETTDPNHSEVGIQTTCEDCHNTAAWNPSTFNHTTTGFELTEGHAGRQCVECHQGTTTGTSSDCYSCHQEDFEQATNPVHQSSGFSLTCTECHTTSPGWQPAEFRQHDAEYFPIYSGEHRGEWDACSTCHTQSDNFAVYSCTVCHEHNQSEMDDEHRGINGYQYESSACLACHPEGSEKSAFNHSSTNFPLTGLHISTQCSACHTDGYAGTPTECSSCHIENYNTAANPDHTSAGIETTCSVCHTTTGWVPSTFDHVTTGFELTGAHNGQQCSACHEGTTVGASQDCYSCHQENYTGAENHVAQGYPLTCTQCHTTVSWESSEFDHNATNFPLTGSHLATECAACHTDGYAGTPTECSSCHIENYNTAANPDHASAGIETTCSTCHTTNGWVPSTFDHVTTGFELTGAHSSQQCSACHEGTTVGASQDCYSCHQENYTGAENHVAQGYPLTCTQCHTTVSWESSEFDHNATNFPLTGSHIATECAACHTDGYAGTPAECSSCHIENYNTAANPDHASAGIETTCSTCHTTNGWAPSTFDHVTTGFELDGAHSGQQCSACHEGTTVGASQDCYSCHQENYTGAENHVAQGYPLTCTQCHTTVSWESSEFDHNATNFPLTGSHIATECAACHTDGYAGTPMECSACHKENYNTAVNPDHASAGIETTCSACHTTTGWAPSTFDHVTTGFELTGAHSSQQCSACHEGTTVGASPDCYSCHQENYTSAENHVAQGYPITCTQCHTTVSWEGAEFDHNATNFPLTGSHIATECAACHTDGYAGTPTECSSCHIENYNTAINPDHASAGIETTCSTCHTTTGWAPSTFDHITTGFELDGAHSGQQCSACHEGTTVGASPDCYSCHQENYTGAENHVAQGYPLTCTQCHTTVSWEGAEFDHNATNFPLTGSHIATECAACHTDGYAGTPTECSACHIENYNTAANPDHASAGIETTCSSCHTTNGWLPSTFDHVTTGFELDGAHSGQQCSACHEGTTVGASQDCYSCHQQNYNEAPNHLAQGYPLTCEQCHSTTTWGDATFDHNSTAFPLTGAHIATECSSCHTNGFAGTPTQCSACHTEDYNTAINPDHASAGIETTCSTCHTTTGWAPSTFDHITTGFELDGAHSGQQCSACHEGTIVGASPDCYSCHQENYTGAENHVAQGYPLTCTQCHSTVSWEGAEFDHNATNFPLTGSHIATECAACHTDGYAGTPTECSSCHIESYNTATNPDHASAGIETTCSACHTTNGWVPSTFDHVTTGFELTGAHRGQQCSACHEGTTVGASQDCYSCHQQNYNEAPNHLAQGYPLTCEQCHSTTTWGNATFDHNSTAFPLTGAHIATECSACHTNGFAGTSTLCSACHTEDYNTAVNPDHASAGIETTCSTCHTTNGWVPSTFDHITTGFELTGAHNGQQCSACHQGTTVGASQDCYSCHQQNYNEAPNHLTQGYPLTCEQCHTTTTWGDATFDHNSTAFPLTGAHIATECSACHKDGFAGTPTDCVSCHQDNYNQTTNPDHQNLGLSTDCQLCHTTNSGWEPATFPVHQSYYALNGAHATVANDCYLCHNGDYNNTSNTCYGCHASDYNNTTDPAHATAQFPTDCLSCHTENAWEPSTFDHDGQYFPIYSGEHSGEWNSCSDCHTVTSNYSVFSCIDCHEHNSADMNSEHSDVNGYVYNSANCYACHPDGRAEDD